MEQMGGASSASTAGRGANYSTVFGCQKMFQGQRVATWKRWEPATPLAAEIIAKDANETTEVAMRRPTVSPSCPAVPFMGGVTSTSTLELFGRFLSVGGETRPPVSALAAPSPVGVPERHIQRRKHPKATASGL